MPEGIAQRIKVLRHDYLARLPKTARDIRALWQALVAPAPPADAHRDLVQHLHRLAGSGGAFGFDDLSQAARALETYVGEEIAPGRQPTGEQTRRVAEYLAGFEAVVGTCLASDASSGAFSPRVPSAGGDVRPVVFVLDDDPDFTTQLARELERMGCAARVFRDVAGFTEALADQRPDAAILDIAVGDDPRAGLRAARSMRGSETDPRIPVVFLTARDDFETRIEAVRAGGSHYFTKPVEVQRLALALEKVLQPEEVRGYYRVLLVDDDAALGAMYRGYLAQRGIRLTAVNDPFQAMAAIATAEPELILLDVRMPGCTGIELAAAIRQNDTCADIPIVFLSAETDLDRQLAAMNIGGDEFLTKPIAPERLAAALLPRVARARSNREYAEQAQTTLRALAHLQAALDRHAIVSIADAAGCIVYVNDRFCEASGYSRAELIGQDHRIVNSRQHPPEFFGEMWRAVGAGRIWQGEIRNRARDGSLYWVEATIVPFLDERDRPYQYISIHTDVTEIKRIAEALAESEARFRSIFESAALGISVLDRHGRFLDANPSLLDLLGYGAEELRRLSFRDVTHPEDSDRGADSFEQVVAGRHPSGRFEQRLRRKDGKTVWARVTVNRVAAGDGGLRYLAAMVEDITAERRALESLRLLERAFQDVPSGVVIADATRPGYPILSVNPAFERLTGYAAAEALERNCNFLQGPERAQPAVDELRAALQAQREARVILRNFRKDGTPFWNDLLLGPVHDAQGRVTHFVGILTDISERIRSEHELVRAREEAERANRAKSQFLSSMSHELRTPLNAIIGFAQVLEADASHPLSPTQRESTALILKAGWHLLELIGETLDLSKIEMGALRLSIEDVCLQDTIRECLDFISPQAERHGIRLLDRLTDCDGVYVRGDRTRLRQALLNLLSNAVKYNRAGGRVAVACTRAGNRVRIAVEDTGQGMTSAQQADLFSPFNRLGREAAGVEGTGIGLVISKRLVEMMGGNIGVESRPGDGSLFWIELPLSTVPAARATAIAEAAPGPTAAPAAGQRATVLYVEDNPTNLRLMERILAADAGLRLLTAATGSHGIALARDRRPDLVVLDLNLPGMDGYEVLNELRRHPETHNIPAIALSAVAAPSETARGLAAGFSHYLTKPLDVKKFFEALQELLTKGRT